MQETIFVRTCSLLPWNQCRLAEDLRRWLPHASIYVQNHPLRIAVCNGSVAIIINETDIFSFVQRSGRVHDIINHSEKQNKVKVSIGDKDFLIETFVAKTVGDTENMKFRLTCLFDPELSRDFDDYASLSNELNNYLWDSVDRRLMQC